MAKHRLPDFLLIGAMKAGTTSLYSDLLTHPRIFMPAEKEPDALCRDEVLSEAGQAVYAELFVSAGQDQLCGEASTSYTKRPTFQHVAQRALKVLGPNLKLIYSVREPVSRTISEYYHYLSSGQLHLDIDRAIQTDRTLSDHSCYAMQLEPWIDTFGREAIHVVHFERYIKDRQGTVAQLQRFLGLEPQVSQIRTSQIVHRSADKPMLTQGWKKFTHHPLYRRLLRPLLSHEKRNRLKRRVLPKRGDSPPLPTMQSIDHILDRVRTDVQQLQQILGDPQPLWDLDQVRRNYAGQLADQTLP